MYRCAVNYNNRYDKHSRDIKQVLEVVTSVFMEQTKSGLNL